MGRLGHESWAKGALCPPPRHAIWTEGFGALGTFRSSSCSLPLLERTESSFGGGIPPMKSPPAPRTCPTRLCPGPVTGPLDPAAFQGSVGLPRFGMSQFRLFLPAQLPGIPEATRWLAVRGQFQLSWAGFIRPGHIFPVEGTCSLEGKAKESLLGASQSARSSIAPRRGL